jgi:hypothetical protein
VLWRSVRPWSNWAARELGRTLMSMACASSTSFLRAVTVAACISSTLSPKDF